jgi:2-methylisocitrate lyase-like PEP mutase family enzyme
MSPSIAQKRADFRRMHAQGCFVLPNPWDVGSAKMLASMGFKALATTSAGFAWSEGRPDNRVTREMVLAHLREIVSATELPVNADFEGGFAETPDGVAKSVRMAIATGVAALSIEDSTGVADAPLRDIDDAVARLRAARNAIDAEGGDTLLVGRAENFIAGRPDLGDTIGRLKAYSDAGADVLYAPGLRTKEHIAAVVAGVAPKPFNLLIGWASELTLDEVAQLGVRRISVGGAMARAAWGGFLRAARGVQQGRFDVFADAVPGTDLNQAFRS